MRRAIVAKALCSSPNVGWRVKIAASKKKFSNEDEDVCSPELERCVLFIRSGVESEEGLLA